MIFNSVIENIHLGKTGGNVGLNLGLPQIIDYVPNVQKENMYLIGGESGSGKSAFAYNHFIYTPFEDWRINFKQQGVKLKIFLWSMEMSKEIVITKAICRKIFLDTKILVDVNYILSRGKNKINSEIYDKVIATKNYFEELEDVLTILPSENATGFNKTMLRYLKDNGKVETKPVEIIEDGEKKTLQIFDKYVPNNEQYVIAIADHIALTKREKGGNKKDAIDKMSEYAISLRNNFKVIPVFVQQLNRDLSSTDRFKQGRVSPQLSDFKESGDTVDAANYVFALFSPMRYDLIEYKGYNIERLRNRFRSLFLLKTRDGEADINCGLAFLGEVGMFKNIRKSTEFTEQQYKEIENYVKYTQNG